MRFETLFIFAKDCINVKIVISPINGDEFNRRDMLVKPVDPYVWYKEMTVLARLHGEAIVKKNIAVKDIDINEVRLWPTQLSRKWV